MRITYACPECHATAAVDDVENAATIHCPRCGGRIALPADGFVRAVEPPRLARCLVCPSTELFVRKDFPQKLGVGIVVAGLAGSCVAWGFGYRFWTYGILFATAAIDALLFLIFSDCLTCYRCGARYRGPGVTERHEPFNLETHEKHRQMTARTAAVSGAMPPPQAAAADASPD